MEMSSDNQSNIISLGHQSYAPNYKPRDVVFESGLAVALCGMLTVMNIWISVPVSVSIA